MRCRYSSASGGSGVLVPSDRAILCSAKPLRSYLLADFFERYINKLILYIILFYIILFCYSTLYRKRQKLDRASKAADKSTNSKHDKSNSNNNTTSSASAEIDEIDSADEMEAPTLEEQVRVYV